ncbi:hypothetical protein AB2L28_19020 [Kineococcus sp. TBRC 1896]|uniref:Uncharacterized protein n=1 Tax=Kineococcus mangrovi TaxID=1660183 RepID=A0ABV4I6L5_9ACTN
MREDVGRDDDEIEETVTHVADPDDLDRFVEGCRGFAALGA